MRAPRYREVAVPAEPKANASGSLFARATRSSMSLIPVSGFTISALTAITPRATGARSLSTL